VRHIILSLRGTKQSIFHLTTNLHKSLNKPSHLSLQGTSFRHCEVRSNLSFHKQPSQIAKQIIPSVIARYIPSVIARHLPSVFARHEAISLFHTHNPYNSPQKSTISHCEAYDYVIARHEAISPFHTHTLYNSPHKSAILHCKVHPVCHCEAYDSIIAKNEAISLFHTRTLYNSPQKSTISHCEAPPTGHCEERSNLSFPYSHPLQFTIQIHFQSLQGTSRPSLRGTKQSLFHFLPKADLTKQTVMERHKAIFHFHSQNLYSSKNKSAHSGFTVLIRSILLCLDPPLICFSRSIAALISLPHS